MGWQEAIKVLCELLCRIGVAEVQDGLGRIVDLGDMVFRLALDQNLQRCWDRVVSCAHGFSVR